MKISEDVNDDKMKEQAKVNFGMANASLKWTNHVTGIIESIENQQANDDKLDEEDLTGKEEEAVDEAAAEDEED